MELKIISRENIKPATPTPDDLRIYKVSILDQLCAHAYIPFILLYSNNQNSAHPDVASERRLRLKNSLSETLARFYPVAGEVKDNLHIQCNDNGVYYVEAQVNCELSDFLKLSEEFPVRRLFPFDPDSEELMSKNGVAMIQVSSFSCGGFAVALLTTHRLIDAYSSMTFLKAWAATTQGYPDEINPSFDAPSIFPQNPSLTQTASMVMWPPLFQRPKCVPRRFVFDASALVALKEKARSSRVVAVIGLIWKCAMAASKLRYGFQKPSVLSVSVNLRARSSPSLPQYSIGNIFWFVTATCTGKNELELSSIVRLVQEAVTKIDDEFVDGLKGDQGSLKMKERLKQLEEDVYSDNESEYYVATSLCNAGFNEIDFGWGKPQWTCHGAPDSDNPGLTNLMFLTDTQTGDGIEALVSLSEETMAVLQRDPELHAFASIS